MREIRMLRLTRRELETGPEMATAPALDPTCEGLGVRFPRATLLPVCEWDGAGLAHHLSTVLVGLRRSLAGLKIANLELLIVR